MNDEELWREWPQDPRVMVSNKGNVVSCKRGTPYQLKVCYTNNGYQMVSAGSGSSTNKQYVHRMLAETWIDNPNHYEQVNHIDGNKDNNSVENLEWVSPSENIRHAYRTGLKTHTGGLKPTPIRCVETGEIFESQHECARRIGGSQGAIQDCLSGRRRTHRGYHFEYVED